MILNYLKKPKVSNSIIFLYNIIILRLFFVFLQHPTEINPDLAFNLTILFFCILIAISFYLLVEFQNNSFARLTTGITAAIGFTISSMGLSEFQIIFPKITIEYYFLLKLVFYFSGLIIFNKFITLFTLSEKSSKENFSEHNIEQNNLNKIKEKKLRLEIELKKLELQELEKHNKVK